ncbi:hypothetical protein BDY21DRAFT_277082 [Lineolata rhizophorae]|uniref:Chromosome transmission fidelity protein 4 n=1 Tax=Lineolata rhizophorae TaxID=578093 RepID=A0A6A6PG11_9PEZI|nr:hypothetical protein BDY21DRAFT_277082 [Lineolata rhizophorae]
MRRYSPTGLLARLHHAPRRNSIAPAIPAAEFGDACENNSPQRQQLSRQKRNLARVRDSKYFDASADVFRFSSTKPAASIDSGGGGPEKDTRPPNERDLKLGKTLRILRDRLPTLLTSPLPQEILSPQITLHLFPSTHPHLPTVTGKIPYTAALWTAPVAWGRVPVVGNIRLDIQSERLVRNGGALPSTLRGPGDGSAGSASYRSEKLIVRWKTCGKSKRTAEATGKHGQVDKITELLGRDDHRNSDDEFAGLFIFEFDDEGRIVAHTIEHAQEGGDYEKTTKFISVTDWLLGKAWRKPEGEEEVQPGLAMNWCDERGGKRPSSRGSGR